MKLRWNRLSGPCASRHRLVGGATTYEQRYIPGQRLYMKEESPAAKANVIFHNNDIDNPELIIQRPANQTLEPIVANP